MESPDLLDLAHALALSDTFQLHLLVVPPGRDPRAIVGLLEEQWAAVLGRRPRVRRLTPGARTAESVVAEVLEPLRSDPGEAEATLVDATGVDPEADGVWAFGFARLNEMRNAVVAWRRPVVLVLPEGRLSAFVVNAPDTWSIRSEVVRLPALRAESPDERVSPPLNLARPARQWEEHHLPLVTAERDRWAAADEPEVAAIWAYRAAECARDADAELAAETVRAVANDLQRGRWSFRQARDWLLDCGRWLDHHYREAEAVEIYALLAGWPDPPPAGSLAEVEQALAPAQLQAQLAGAARARETVEGLAARLGALPAGTEDLGRRLDQTWGVARELAAPDADAGIDAALDTLDACALALPEGGPRAELEAEAHLVRAYCDRGAGRTGALLERCRAVGARLTAARIHPDRRADLLARNALAAGEAAFSLGALRESLPWLEAAAGAPGTEPWVLEEARWFLGRARLRLGDLRGARVVTEALIERHGGAAGPAPATWLDRDAQRAWQLWADLLEWDGRPLAARAVRRRRDECILTQDPSPEGLAEARQRALAAVEAAGPEEPKDVLEAITSARAVHARDTTDERSTRSWVRALHAAANRLAEARPPAAIGLLAEALPEARRLALAFPGPEGDRLLSEVLISLARIAERSLPREARLWASEGLAAARRGFGRSPESVVDRQSLMVAAATWLRLAHRSGERPAEMARYRQVRELLRPAPDSPPFVHVASYAVLLLGEARLGSHDTERAGLQAEAYGAAEEADLAFRDGRASLPGYVKCQVALAQVVGDPTAPRANLSQVSRVLGGFGSVSWDGRTDPDDLHAAAVAQLWLARVTAHSGRPGAQPRAHALLRRASDAMFQARAAAGVDWREDRDLQAVFDELASLERSLGRARDARATQQRLRAILSRTLP